MAFAIATRKKIRFSFLIFTFVVAMVGCHSANGGPGNLPPGVAIEQTTTPPLHVQMSNAITSAPPRFMNGGGLVGVLGGARVKMLQAGQHEVMLPLPQLADSQIPICYAIVTTPREAGMGFALRQRPDSNVVVSVQLNGSRDQEIRIEWSSIILITQPPASPNQSRPEPYLQATACVQSGAGPLTKLADKLWPPDGKTAAYAASIQEFIRTLKQQKPPRSLDASGILESGANGICTANANLAAALLRSKKIPTRSLAVIPPTGQRLEMHRIVEYFENGQWLPFDPSSLHADIPLKPWHNILMAKTTIGDEELAMKPRMGAMLGCPYGQELELMDGGLTLWGQDFFWTIGKPIAEFEAIDEAIGLARRKWNRFLESGKLSPGQMNAIAVRDATGLLEVLKTK